MSFSVSHLAEARAIIDRLDTDVIERMAVLLAELRDRKGRLFFLGVGHCAKEGDVITLVGEAFSAAISTVEDVINKPANLGS